MSLDTFGFDPASYSIAINLFIRLLGALYIFVFLPFLWQMKGLFGKNGIRPIQTFIDNIRLRFGKKGIYYVPSLFWIKASDSALLALIWAGIVLGTLLMFGIYPTVVLFLLYIVHLSLTTAGQDFLSFGWETFLLETTLGSFLLLATTPYNSFAWIGLNLLIFRFHFQAGASKIMSQDRNWRNLTALSYHYLSQPIPNTQAWFFHKLPMWFHKASCVMMFYMELIVPFAIFAPPELRLFAFIQLIGLQFFIWFTGNFSYLNHMTVVLCLLLLNNCYLSPFISAPAILEPSPLLWSWAIDLAALAFLVLQFICLVSPYFPRRIFREILVWVEPFHLAYPHGIFAVMTTKRIEIIIEGSNDGITWKEYEFYHKPGDLSRRPKRISPFQPRLDWQAWFLPLGRQWNEWWFQSFLTKLLVGSPDVLKLLRHNPFHEKPPNFIRALAYDYEYTTFKEKKERGHWWKRRFVGFYSPALQLTNRNASNP